jgi:hypothetical protein
MIALLIGLIVGGGLLAFRSWLQGEREIESYALQLAAETRREEESDE